MSNNRIEWIDTLKGIGIVMVVWGHLNIPLVPETIIYSFHMPLFFFISGYLYRNERKDMKILISKKGKSLLVPYLFFAALTVPTGIIIKKISSEDIIYNEIFMNFFFLNGSVGWNSPLWFLVVLFLVEILFEILNRSNQNLKVIILIFFVIGYLLSKTNIEFPLGLHIVSWSLVFYYLGFIFKTKKVIELLSLNKIIYIISLLVFSICNILFGLLLNVRVSLYHNFVGNYLYFYISALAGIIFIFLVVSKLPKLKLLSYLGVNTLIILVSHYYVIYFYEFISKFLLGYNILRIDNYMISFLLTLITISICMFLSKIFNKYLPFAIGK